MLTTFVAYRLLFVRATIVPPSGTSRTAGPRWMAVANRDIQPLETLDRRMFRLMPATDQTPEEAVTSLERFDGQIATNFIAKDEPVTAGDVDFPDPRYGAMFQLPAGFRAMAVPVNPVSGIAGFLKPGNRVDVLGTFVDKEGIAWTRTVVEDAVLLAFGQNLREEPKPNEEGAEEEPAEEQSAAATPDTATLIVSPAQAESLALAASRAKLNLVLRGVKPDPTAFARAPMPDPHIEARRRGGIPDTTAMARAPGDREANYWRLARDPIAASGRAGAAPAGAAGAAGQSSGTVNVGVTPEMQRTMRQAAEVVRAARELEASRKREAQTQEDLTRPVIVIRGTRQEVVQVPR
jgi:pilus assembly protein CpaB